jgi:hypothetical protein
MPGAGGEEKLEGNHVSPTLRGDRALSLLEELAQSGLATNHR